MKYVVWIDDLGRKRRSLIKDNDDPSVASQGVGIPADPPDVRAIDLESLFREIEALQYERGLFDWRAVNNDQVGMQACINVFRKKFLELYRNS